MTNDLEGYMAQRIDKYFSDAIASGFKELLENKHLYQNYQVIFPDFGKVAKEAINQIKAGTLVPVTKGNSRFNQKDFFETIIRTEWAIYDPIASKRTGGFVSQTEKKEVITFTPLPVRIVCINCESLEPFNFVSGGDLLANYNLYYQGQDQASNQVFYIAYLCQRCKIFPEVFLIKRQEDKLQLTGRSPIEKVQVAPFIPKQQRHFFSDAIIAYNSGQVLAANFLLRTFIEQYVRSKNKTPDTDDIDLLFR